MNHRNLIKEILICFEKQYPERYDSYKRFFENTLSNKHPLSLTNEVLVYCNMLVNLDILVSLIKKEEQTTEVQNR